MFEAEGEALNRAGAALLLAFSPNTAMLTPLSLLILSGGSRD